MISIQCSFALRFDRLFYSRNADKNACIISIPYGNIFRNFSRAEKFYNSV